MRLTVVRSSRPNRRIAVIVAALLPALIVLEGCSPGPSGGDLPASSGAPESTAPTTVSAPPTASAAPSTPAPASASPAAAFSINLTFSGATDVRITGTKGLYARMPSELSPGDGCRTQLEPSDYPGAVTDFLEIEVLEGALGLRGGLAGFNGSVIGATERGVRAPITWDAGTRTATVSDAKVILDYGAGELFVSGTISCPAP